MALIEKLTAIGDAIRGKTGTAELLTLDAMAAAIAGIESGGSGGGNSDALTELIGAFSYDSPTVMESSVYKEFLPVPKAFDTCGVFTNTAATLSLSITANAGDTLLLACVFRGLQELPETPEGWELILQCEPHVNDSYEQSMLIYKKIAENNGSITVSMTQPDTTKRFYMNLTNIRDSKVGANSEVRYITQSENSNISETFEIPSYNHILMFRTNALIFAAGDSIDVNQGVVLNGIVDVDRSRINYLDPTDKGALVYNSRLAWNYIPWANSNLSKSASLSTLDPEYEKITILSNVHYSLAFLEIIPGKNNYYVGVGLPENVKVIEKKDKISGNEFMRMVEEVL